MAGQRISEETRARIARAWPDILTALAAGELVRNVLRKHDVSADMLRAYRASEPSARQEWEDAREQSADALFEEALQIARDPFEEIADPTGADKPLVKVRRDPSHARVMVDTLKWAARIRNPRLYSDKSTLDVNVRTVDLTRIIEAAQARLAAQRAPRILDMAPELERLPAPADLAELL